jgi:hypothetical protein
MNPWEHKGSFIMNKIHQSLIQVLVTTASIVTLASYLTAQAGQILEEPDGWDRSNVVVRIYDVEGILRDSVVYPDIDYTEIIKWPDGYYESDIYDMAFINGSSGETLMATLVAKNPPVGVPPGVKVLNDFHIRFHISGRVDDRPDTPDLAPVIKISQHDGNVRPPGDMVKAGFPVHDFPAGPGRRNHQDHSWMCAKGLYRPCHNMG